MNKSIFSINPVSLTICNILLVVVFFISGVPLLDLIELKTYDLRFRSRNLIKPSPKIVLAVIDEKSLDVEGRWPWPRNRFASLINILSRDGAKVIGFDIGFLEPDENSNLDFISNLSLKIDELDIKEKELTDFINKSKKNADNDLLLANAIINSDTSTVLGYFFHMKKDALNYTIDQQKIEKQLERIDSSKYTLINFEKDSIEENLFITAYAPEGNLKILSDATKASGYFNMFPDSDGAVRWMPLIIKCGEDIFPSLSLQCARYYLDQPQCIVKVARYGVTGIRMGERFLRTDEKGQMLINFLGPPQTFPHFSISDILQGNIPEGTFKDTVVLVGATAIGIYDLRITPFSPVYPGLEIHATVVDNIIKQNFLYKPVWARIYDLLSIILLGALIGAALPRLNAIKGILLASGLFVFHIAMAFWLFTGFGIWLNILYPLLALVLTYTSLTVYHYITEERERKKIKGAFSYYVSSSVVNEMLKHPEQLKLGGEKKDLSVLFSDIRGFTSISENLTPEALVHLLNEYLTVMTDVVFKYKGTLDKYMGDAIMAIYGAPLNMADHPSLACHSAIEMMQKLKSLNEKWISEGKNPMDIGIGINTGMMMVGNMGSDQRFDYTVMGDEVNLGSRLEGTNKNYKTNILISEFTYERIKNEFLCMEVDSVQVKGKTLPVRIYQLHFEKQASEARKKAVLYFEKGIQLYKQQEWEKAIEVFKRVLEMDKGIRAAAVYINRCNDLKVNPPPPEWNGIYIMTTK